MHYIIYRTTNKINGKIYIGAHKTENLQDGYLGSGHLLRKAITKHGRCNFYREVLLELPDEKTMYEKEAEIVNAEFIASPDTYNAKIGGRGGGGYLNAEARLKGRRKIQHLLKTDPTYRSVWLDKRKRVAKMHNFKYAFLGKKHTMETKKIIAANSARHQSGEGNSQYGTKWICHAELPPKKIGKHEPIPEGWYKGRKIKNKR